MAAGVGSLFVDGRLRVCDRKLPLQEGSSKAEILAFGTCQVIG